MRKLVIYAENPDLYSQIAPRFPELEVEVYTGDDRFVRAVEDAEIIFMARKFSKEMLQGAKRLRWLHLAATGIDRLLPLSDLYPYSPRSMKPIPLNSISRTNKCGQPVNDLGNSHSQYQCDIDDQI